jgi:hypothetical protein
MKQYKYFFTYSYGTKWPPAFGKEYRPSLPSHTFFPLSVDIFQPPCCKKLRDWAICTEDGVLTSRIPCSQQEKRISFNGTAVRSKTITPSHVSTGNSVYPVYIGTSPLKKVGGGIPQATKTNAMLRPLSRFEHLLVLWEPFHQTVLYILIKQNRD